MTPDLDLFSPKTACELVPDFFVGAIGRMDWFIEQARYSVSRLITSPSAFGLEKDKAQQINDLLR